MSTIDSPTLPEQYTRAMHSSHLELEERTRGDADLLVAAGLAGRHYIPDCPQDETSPSLEATRSRNRLAVLLYRLCSEWDGAKQEASIARKYIVEKTMEADKLAKRYEALKKAYEAAPSATPEDLANRLNIIFARKAIGEQVEAMRSEIARELISDRAFTMMRLKSLHEAKQALFDWAMVMATKRRFMKSNLIVATLVGQVLDIFLDPRCHRCQGRGYNGGWSVPRRPCRACGENGFRRHGCFGKDQTDDQFARMLLAEMEQMLDTASRRMKRLLARHES